MGEEPARDRAHQQRDGGREPPVPLGVVAPEEEGVHEQIAVDAGQDDARERLVPQHPARDGLAAALEGDQGDGHEDAPVELVGRFVVGAEGDHGGRGKDEDELEQEGAYKDPSALGREVGVEPAECKGAEAEAGQRGEGFPPPVGLGRRGDAQADEYRVACCFLSAT